MGTAVNSQGEKIFTVSSVIGLIIFFLIALQCMSTVGVQIRESGSWKFALTQLVAFNVFAYVLVVLLVQGLRFIGHFMKIYFDVSTLNPKKSDRCWSLYAATAAAFFSMHRDVKAIPVVKLSRIKNKKAIDAILPPPPPPPPPPPRNPSGVDGPLEALFLENTVFIMGLILN